MQPGEQRTERKVVTVLFADLVGFTSRAEQLDPEDVEAILRPYHQRLRGELERFGGTVEKFIGDAVMAVFGAPVAHEDDPERAVRAALSIRDAFADERETLQLRIGVNTGEALVRLDVRPSEGEAMVAGDVVNTAARLQAAAPENGILVGEATFRATDRVIEYCDAEAVLAKGKAEPVPVHEAVATRSRFGVDVAERHRTPLVGRAGELDVLVGALARARAGVPQLVSLVGVPGIGKTRLVSELFRLVDEDDELIFWRQGRSLPYGAGVTYWALAEMAKAHAGILESDTAEVAEEKLTRVAADLARDDAEAAWLAGHVRPLVGLARDGESGSERREESFAAWRRLLEAIADQGPLVLVFEDVHWADDGVLDFVDGLVERVASVPLLVVCTARPELLERRPGWGGGKRNAVTLSLTPLTDDETALLVAGLLDRPVLEAGTQAALLERAGGNPLYAEEFVRMLAGRGAGASALPETVQGIVAARLDLLPAEEKALLLDAAVLGKVFWPGALAHVSDRGRFDVEELLHRLERKEFVRRDRRSSVAGEDEYVFLHVLVRDVAYSHLPRAARADRHRRAAEWLESLPADRSEDRAEMLAHHYVSALDYATAAGQEPDDLPARAHAALREAGDRALGLNAFPAASRFYVRALEVGPGSEEPDPSLLLATARARMYAEGSGDEEARHAAEVFEARGQPAEAAEAYLVVGELDWRRGRTDLASPSFERAAELVVGVEDSAPKATVLSGLARFRMLSGRQREAVAHARAAIALAERLGLRQVQAHALNNLGVVRVLGGDERGVQDLERSIEIGLAVGSGDVYRGYTNLASVSNVLGRLRRAAELHATGLEAARRIGNVAASRWLQAELAADAYRTGDWDEALRRVDAFFAEAVDPHYMERQALEVRALIATARGDLDRALDDTAHGLRLAREARDPQSLVPSLLVRSFVAVLAGDEAEGAAVFDEALERGRMEPLHLFECGAPVAWLGARLDRAMDVRNAVETAPLKSLWVEAAETFLGGDLAAAAARYAEFDAVTDEAWTRLEAADRLIAAGRRAEAEAHLARALAFYRSVGATAYVRRADKLLRASA